MADKCFTHYELIPTDPESIHPFSMLLQTRGLQDDSWLAGESQLKRQTRWTYIRDGIHDGQGDAAFQFDLKVNIKTGYQISILENNIIS